MVASSSYKLYSQLYQNDVPIYCINYFDIY